MANESSGSTKQLKQVLGFTDLMGTAVGQIIGAGVMTLLGSAMLLTGRSVPFAFLIAAVIVIGYSIPFVIICSAARVRGGNYTMIGMLAGKRMTGVYTILYICSNVSLAMYALSFASYFISLFGVGNQKIIAFIMATAFFVINCCGVDVMAKFQTVIVGLLVVALIVFAVAGVPQIQPGYFEESTFMTNGVFGLFQAGGLLTFAVGGGTCVSNLSAEAKNPTRDIPLVIIVSTLGVAVLYGFVAFVAAGVLPLEEVAGQNLSLVASAILSRPLYIFFMVCGAMFALISTLNAQFGWATKPILQACDDGWLPKFLGYLHPKTKAPICLLTILYAIAVVCIFSGLSISILSNLCIISGGICTAIICAFMYRIKDVCPNGWKNSKFKVSDSLMKVLVVYATASEIFNIYLNASQLSMGLLLGNVVMIVVAVLFAFVRMNKTNVEISYEEMD